MNERFKMAKMGWVVLAVTLIAGCASDRERRTPTGQRVASREQAVAALTDVWGEAALKRPEGPTYEYFRDLLPPLRYVDADFKCYPIALSAPNAALKARLVSDGSAVNALARQANWKGESGVPVKFFVGDRREPYGQDLGRLVGPTYLNGYLPVTQMKYTTADGAAFEQEAFAPVSEEMSRNGVVMVKFTLVKSAGIKRGGKRAAQSQGGAATRAVAGVESAENAALNLKVYDEKMEVRFETGEVNLLKEGNVTSGDGATVLGTVWPQFSSAPGRGAAIVPMTVGESAYVLIYTKPAEESTARRVTPDLYRLERERCVDEWEGVLARGMRVDTPEKVVNDAWRASIIGDYMLFNRDQIHYSAGNQYAKRYIGEGGDTLRATALWGHTRDAARLMPAQFEYTRKGLEFHQAALKLQMLAHYFQLTRDAEFLQKIRPMWEKEIAVILEGRESSTGMLPREKYCGDIATMVYSLNSNSNCWRALRDMGWVLNQLGEHKRGDELQKTAAEYRQVILKAIDHAKRRDVSPPFVPIALSGEEDPPRPIWGSTIGSYWNLMIEYVLGSGVFAPDSQTATEVIHYIQQNGGMLMGIVRARSEALNFWVSGGRLNDLYGMRYALTLLRRDEPDRALVSFYGKLAQGFTRDTFIGGEGSSIGSVDRYGRQMYLPPNSAGNANYLQQLRYLLVQDYDIDDDGAAETLRLLFATPRAWLADGKRLAIEKAPTAFGEVSLVAESRLKQGRVSLRMRLPSGRGLGHAMVRLRMPDGYRVTSATAGAKSLTVTGGETIDLTGLSGPVTIEAAVAR